MKEVGRNMFANSPLETRNRLALIAESDRYCEGGWEERTMSGRKHPRSMIESKGLRARQERFLLVGGSVTIAHFTCTYTGRTQLKSQAVHKLWKIIRNKIVQFVGVSRGRYTNSVVEAIYPLVEQGRTNDGGGVRRVARTTTQRKGKKSREIGEVLFPKDLTTASAAGRGRT